MDQARTREHLAEADNKIEKAEKRIADQRERIAELSADGHTTAEAEKLLSTYLDVFEAMVEHRKTILDELAKDAP